MSLAASHVKRATRRAMPASPGNTAQPVLSSSMCRGNGAGERCVVEGERLGHRLRRTRSPGLPVAEELGTAAEPVAPESKKEERTELRRTEGKIRRATAQAALAENDVEMPTRVWVAGSARASC